MLLVEDGTLVGERSHYRLEQTPTELHISPTVQGVLAARIDRLTADEKALLQQLAVIGRQFAMSLVKQVVHQSEVDLYRVLAALQAKEFLYEQPAFPESDYLFKHALTQEVAYGTVLQEQRKALHEQTGQALERLYRTSLSDHYPEAVTLAHEVSHPFSLAFALNFTARLHQLRREQPAVQAGAEAAIALSTEQGFPFFLAMGTILRGWAVAEQGQGAAGISQLRKGLATYQATGAEIWRPYFLALLAEVQGKAGQTEAGLRGVNEALAMVERTEERFYEAELHRLKGELVLQSGVRSPESEAERCFQQALDIAQKQQAKSWELRAATSLARLWQKQGQTTEARELLAPVYNWFTEGFDTKDLQEAKALIEELNSTMRI